MEVLAFGLNDLGSALLAAFGLGLVIFIHELGHFAVAKWCDVKVERFSIGFGPALCKFTKGETEYVLAALPLGGFVKMLGQDDADPGQMTDQQVAKDPRSYTSKSVPQRIAIISAGVLCNLITAVMFFIIAFLLGVKYQPAVIGSVLPGGPSWQSDLRIGDQILQIGNRNEAKLSFTDLRLASALSQKDEDLEVIGQRNGKTFSTKVRPVVLEGQLMPQIFVEPTRSLQFFELGISDDPTLLTHKGLAASRAQPPFESEDLIVELNGKKLADYAELVTELAIHSNERVEFGIRRKSAREHDALTKILVDPNPFQTFGMTMAIGEVAAIRKGSPAESAGFQRGDTITHLVVRENEELAVGTGIDPMQLPDYFSDRAGQEVHLKVKREMQGGSPQPVDIYVTPETRPAWIDRPSDVIPDCPLSIPSIGVAFHVLHHVVAVSPAGPAEKAGLQVGDDVVMVRFSKKNDGNSDDTKKKSKAADELKIEFDTKARNWPATFWIAQTHLDYNITIVTKSPKSENTIDHQITLEPVANWYLPMRGFVTQPRLEILKAANIGEATQLGFRRTRDSMIEMWMTINNLIAGRISHKAFGGPIRIVGTAFAFSQQGVPDLILFLGILSVSLAVMNFLPIPVLDGGHFVFLCWEGIRGKPPSEKVVMAATYMGLAFILSLMAFVFYTDISALVTGK